MFSRFQNNDFWQKNFSGKIDTKKFPERLTHFRIFGGTQNVSIFPGELYMDSEKVMNYQKYPTVWNPAVRGSPMQKAPAYVLFQIDSPFCKNVHSQSLFIFRNE